MPHLPPHVRRATLACATQPQHEHVLLDRLEPVQLVPPRQADGMRAPHVRRATHVLQPAGGHYDHLPLDQVHQKHLVHHLRCVLSNMLVFIYSIEWDHWYEGSPWTPSPGSHWPTASCLSHTQGPLKQRIWSMRAPHVRACDTRYARATTFPWVRVTQNTCSSTYCGCSKKPFCQCFNKQSC